VSRDGTQVWFAARVSEPDAPWWTPGWELARPFSAPPCCDGSFRPCLQAPGGRCALAEESLLRRQLRNAVVSGGTVLREAAGGVREGLQLLQVESPASDRITRLERELQDARNEGRWLSDEERAELAAEREAALRSRAAESRQRRSLVILLVVSILLPPFWPLALGLTAYLLFPRTTRRLTVLALVLVGLGVALLIAALIALLVLH